MTNRKILNMAVNVYNYLNNNHNPNNLEIESVKDNLANSFTSYNYYSPDGYITIDENFMNKTKALVFVLGGSIGRENFSISIWFNPDESKIYYTRDGSFRKNKLNSDQIEKFLINVIDRLNTNPD